MSQSSESRLSKAARAAAKLTTGAGLVGAGVAHLTVARKEFRAQVPEIIPLPKDKVIVASGFAEIGLGLATMLSWKQPMRARMGTLMAAYFAAVFPGNVSQFMKSADAFGLDTDGKRFLRLFFQPVLIAGALYGGDRKAMKEAAQESRPTSVTTLNLGRYLGLWYEVGRLPMRFEPENGRDITAHYSLNKAGTVAVLNRVVEDRAGKNRKPKVSEAHGQALPVLGHPGRLRVSFLPTGLRWLPGTRADYWVLRIDSRYETALVGTPDRRFLWLLSRDPHIEPQVEQDYLSTAAEQGYDLRKWIRPEHRND